MRTLFALLLTLTPSVALAHPGHGRGSDWTHHTTEIACAVALVVIAGFAIAWRRSQRQQP